MSSASLACYTRSLCLRPKTGENGQSYSEMGRGISSILRAVIEGNVVFAPRDRAAYIRPPWQPSLVAFLETEVGED